MCEQQDLDSYRSAHFDFSLLYEINAAPSVSSLGIYSPVSPLRAVNAGEESAHVFIKPDETDSPATPHERERRDSEHPRVAPSYMYAGETRQRLLPTTVPISQVSCVSLKRHNAILLMVITNADSFRGGGGPRGGGGGGGG